MSKTRFAFFLALLTACGGSTSASPESSSSDRSSDPTSTSAHPCAAVLCAPNTRCEVVDGEPACVEAAPADGVRCGSTTCALGEVCCNASCGICAPPDGVCTQQLCD